MDITYLELTDADDFTSYTDSEDVRIKYTYAKFTDSETDEEKYGVRVIRYKKIKGGECEVGLWREVSEEEFYEVKNRKR